MNLAVALVAGGALAIALSEKRERRAPVNTQINRALRLARSMILIWSPYTVYQPAVARLRDAVVEAERLRAEAPEHRGRLALVLRVLRDAIFRFANSLQHTRAPWDDEEFPTTVLDGARAFVAFVTDAYDQGWRPRGFAMRDYPYWLKRHIGYVDGPCAPDPCP